MLPGAGTQSPQRNEQAMGKVSGMWRGAVDHFEPDEDVDGAVQRQLRGHLEQIDYTAYAANRKALAALGKADSDKFERLARSAALARTRWMATALAACDGDHPPTSEQIAEMAHHRHTY